MYRLVKCIETFSAVSIFAVSTYNTDYILIKEENFAKAIAILQENGYTVK